MRKNVFLLFWISILPIIGFSQSEKDIKSNIRSQSTNNSSSNQSTTQRITTNEVSDKQRIREDSRTPQIITNHYPVNSFYRWNPWNRWGAPYNYLGFNDFLYIDRFGYGRNARIYQISDVKKDTVLSKKNKVRVGVNLSTDNQLGGWFTVGRAVYFKGQFSGILNSDRSTFYNHPDVNFNNASLVWQDKRLPDITKGWSLYLGVGRELKNIGFNLSLGLGSEKENFQFFDEYFVLSDNGNYSFKNFIDNYVTFSLGLTHDYKFLSLNAELDPIRKNLFVGVGLNF